MKVTYIHHSSFAAELEKTVFLFDYFKGELPELPEEKTLVVFASHRHGDHFAPVIFELAEKYPDVRYVLAKDIPEKQIPDGLKEKVCRLGGDMEYSLELPQSDPVRIRTFYSTDEGVAFLVEAEGKTIYHAGDLNNWIWAGETEQYNRTMNGRYHAELKKMKGCAIDLAFVPLDPRQENDFYRGMDDFMRMVGAKAVFPMHFWGDFKVIRRFKELDCAKAYSSRIMEIDGCGQTFILCNSSEGGKVHVKTGVKLACKHDFT